MFLRGQRVRIIESNAKGRTHPKVDDIGYINNLFLFPTEKFILASIFFCIYGDEQNRRMEHKKFILDLGMDIKMRKQISREGVTKLFFLEKSSVCLTPTFVKTCKRRNNKGYTRYVAQYFPEMVGTHGIWTAYTKPRDTKDRIKDNPFLIPCGNIASDYVVSKRLTDIQYINEVEMASYLNSFGAMLSAMIQLYNEYYDRPSRSFSVYTEKGWDKLSSVMSISTQLDGVYKFKVKPKCLSKTYNYKSIATTIQFMKSLNYTALVRTEDSFLNNAVAEDELVMARVRKLVRREELINLLDPEISVEHGIERTQLGTLLPCMIYKILFADRNNKISINRLHNLLGEKYYDCEKILKEIKEIHKEARSNSAALNRLFGVINASKYDNKDLSWERIYGEKTVTIISTPRTGRISGSSSSSSTGPQYAKSNQHAKYDLLEKLNAEPEEAPEEASVFNGIGDPTEEERDIIDKAKRLMKSEERLAKREDNAWEDEDEDDFIDDDIADDIADELYGDFKNTLKEILPEAPSMNHGEVPYPKIKKTKPTKKIKRTKEVEEAANNIWELENTAVKDPVTKKEQSFAQYLEKIRKEEGSTKDKYEKIEEQFDIFEEMKKEKKDGKIPF